METYFMDNKFICLRQDYKTQTEYRRDYQEANKHYGFKVKVDGGWIFFEFSTDYDIYKNQK
jgi:hypothetical protein